MYVFFTKRGVKFLKTYPVLIITCHDNNIDVRIVHRVYLYLLNCPLFLTAVDDLFFLTFYAFEY